MDEDEDMRDNVIKYNDEGGGEQDTEAYDMSALRSLYDFGELKGGGGGDGGGGGGECCSRGLWPWCWLLCWPCLAPLDFRPAV